MTDETSEQTDGQLTGPSASGVSANTRSIEALVRANYVALYRYAYRLTGSECDAEDLVQQCFLVAHEKLEQLREERAARAWLYQILRSKFFRLCRQRKPSVASDVDLEMQSIADGEVAEALDVEALQSRLNELKDEYRVALLMFYFEDKSYDEIARELQIPIGTVMSRLSRAKSHLRKRIRSSEVLS